MCWSVIPSRREHGLQRAHLVEHVGVAVAGRDAHGPAAEPEQVGQARVRAHLDPVLLAQAHRPDHRHRVAGVEAAGDVGRGDLGDHGLVVAQPPVAEALAEVRVDVDRAHGDLPARGGSSTAARSAQRYYGQSPSKGEGHGAPGAVGRRTTGRGTRTLRRARSGQPQAHRGRRTRARSSRPSTGASSSTSSAASAARTWATVPRRSLRPCMRRSTASCTRCRWSSRTRATSKSAACSPRAPPCSGESKSMLINSGAEAIENAVKISRAATGRPAVLVFDRGFHGRTLLAMTMTSKLVYKKTFGPFAPEIYRVPAPYEYRGITSDDAIREIELAFKATVDPESVACAVLEPVQGEGGFIPMPLDFPARLKELLDRYGILYVDDEIQSGCGRTGPMWAIEHYGVAPDLVTSGKTLGGGLPLAAVTGRAEVMDAPHIGGLGGTFAGNPVSCAAATVVLEELDRPEVRDARDAPRRAHAQRARRRAEPRGRDRRRARTRPDARDRARRPTARRRSRRPTSPRARSPRRSTAACCSWARASTRTASASCHRSTSRTRSSSGAWRCSRSRSSRPGRPGHDADRTGGRRPGGAGLPRRGRDGREGRRPDRGGHGERSRARRLRRELASRLPVVDLRRGRLGGRGREGGLPALPRERHRRAVAPRPTCSAGPRERTASWSSWA